MERIGGPRDVVLSAALSLIVDALWCDLITPVIDPILMGVLLKEELMTEAVLLYMTVSSDDEGRRIGKALVEENLVACVNLLAPMTSLFQWEGAVQEETEVPVVAKTTKDRVDAVVDRVRTLHSYEVPCVVAVPICAGDAGFLSWIGETVRNTG